MYYSIKYITKQSDLIIIIILIGVLIFLFMDLAIFSKLFKDKIKEMNTLVSFLFLVPPQIINENEKFKK